MEAEAGFGLLVCVEGNHVNTFFFHPYSGN